MSEVTEQTIISILPFTCTAQIGEEFSHITDLLKHYLNNYLILLLFSDIFFLKCMLANFHTNINQPCVIILFFWSIK